MKNNVVRNAFVSIAIAMLATFALPSLADTSVSWLSPADGSSYAQGTLVAPTGIASGVGATGGSGLDLALVIDVSGSMGTGIGGGLTRMDAAKSAATALVNALPVTTTSVSIVAFNSSANTVQVLTGLSTNIGDVLSAIGGLNAGGGTIIGGGIDAAITELTSTRHTAGREQQMVVISDGISGGSPATNAAVAAAAGITVHAVGIPGHNATQMAAIATSGAGQYTNVVDISTLTSLFDGTSGNLVGLDYVDIQLADGTWIYDIATDGLGNFILPDQVVALGANVFTAYAYGTDGTSASAQLTLYGTDGPVVSVPEPSSLALLALGLLGLVFSRRAHAQ